MFWHNAIIHEIGANLFKLLETIVSLKYVPNCKLNLWKKTYQAH